MQTRCSFDQQATGQNGGITATTSGMYWRNKKYWEDSAGDNHIYTFALQIKISNLVPDSLSLMLEFSVSHTEDMEIKLRDV